MTTQKNEKNVGWVRPEDVTHQEGNTTLRPLGETVKPTRPRVKPSDKPDLPFIGMEHIEAHTMRLLGTVPASTMKSSAVHFQSGDVLYGRLRPYLNKVYCPDFEGLCSAEFIVFPKSEGIDSRYLQYFLNSSAFVSFASHLNAGDRPRVDFEQLAPYPFPVFPLDQQKRIVAEIEKQFSRLDEAVANLKRVKANLKRYKAAVLKAAVEGRLVETEAELARREGRSLPTPRPGAFYVYAIKCDDDSIYIGHTDDLARRWNEHLAGQAVDWTKQHRPIQIVHYEEYPSRQEASDREKWLKTGYGRKWIKREVEAGRARQVGYETGAQLLQRILETRRSQWKGKGKYKEPAVPDTTDLPELPEGWVWARLDAIADLKGGITVDSKRKDSTARSVPYLRVANVQRGYIDLSEVKYIDAPEADIAALRLQYGDILFNEGGDRDKLGRGWIWENQLEDCIHQNHVFRARLFSADVSSRLVSWWGNSFGKDYFSREGKQTTNLASINLTKLSAFPVPLPPPAEQSRLVAEFDRRLSLLVGS